MVRRDVVSIHMINILVFLVNKKVVFLIVFKFFFVMMFIFFIFSMAFFLFNGYHCLMFIILFFIEILNTTKTNFLK